MFKLGVWRAAASALTIANEVPTPPLRQAAPSRWRSVLGLYLLYREGLDFCVSLALRACKPQSLSQETSVAEGLKTWPGKIIVLPNKDNGQENGN